MRNYGNPILRVCATDKELTGLNLPACELPPGNEEEDLPREHPRAPVPVTRRGPDPVVARPLYQRIRVICEPAEPPYGGDGSHSNRPKNVCHNPALGI